MEHAIGRVRFYTVQEINELQQAGIYIYQKPSGWSNSFSISKETRYGVRYNHDDFDSPTELNEDDLEPDFYQDLLS